NQNQSHRGQRDARGEAADSAPGRLDQVNPQEVVVDVHPAGMLCNEVGELAVNDVGNGDLLIAGAGHDLNAGAFNQTSG
ncbi:helix-turn-helix domain-containing protein, partial [Dysosmobacter welbionis]